MKKSTLIATLFMAAMVFYGSSCKDDPKPEQPENKGTLELTFEFYNGENPMLWDDVVSIDDVNAFKIEFLKFYLSNLSATRTSGEVDKLAEVLLANAAEPLDGMAFSFKLSPGSYDKIKIGFGLDSLLNASDPVQFLPEEPLSAAQAMYWSWATKYRFVRMDAKANENGPLGSSNDILVAYHPGADEFYGEREFINPFTIAKGETTTMRIKIDLAAVFNGPGGIINIPTEPQTHTEPSDYHISVKFIENWIAAFSVL